MNMLSEGVLREMRDVPYNTDLLVLLFFLQIFDKLSSGQDKRVVNTKIIIKVYLVDSFITF